MATKSTPGCSAASVAGERRGRRVLRQRVRSRRSLVRRLLQTAPGTGRPKVMAARTGAGAAAPERSCLDGGVRARHAAGSTLPFPTTRSPGFQGGLGRGGSDRASISPATVIEWGSP